MISTHIKAVEHLLPLQKVTYRDTDFIMSAFPNDYIQKTLSTGVFYEESVTNSILRYHDEYGGGDILDIGMNIGCVSIPVAKFCGDHCQVISIEAMVPTFHRAEANAAMNSVSDKIRMFNVAVQDEPDVTSLAFTVDSNNMGANRVARNGVSVDATTLDQLRDNFKAVKIVKMDIEGSEMKAIRGGDKWLKEYPPCVIVMETDKVNQTEMDDLMMSYDFTSHNATKEGITTDTKNTVYKNKNCKPKEKSLRK